MTLGAEEHRQRDLTRALSALLYQIWAHSSDIKQRNEAIHSVDEQ